jgi:hypothetical protein
MHLVDPQLWGGAVRCQKSNLKDFFSSLLAQCFVEIPLSGHAAEKVVNPAPCGRGSDWAEPRPQEAEAKSPFFAASSR